MYGFLFRDIDAAMRTKFHELSSYIIISFNSDLCLAFSVITDRPLWDFTDVTLACADTDSKFDLQGCPRQFSQCLES